jgi:diguanylate cyclase (GGDEF)-like protein
VVLTVIPKHHPERALRLRRQLMAIYSYCLMAIGVLAGMHQGLFSTNMPFATIFGVLLLFNVIVFIVTRAGMTEILRDPSLTKLQIFAGMLLITVILHYCEGSMRGAMMGIYFMIMTFGIFALPRKEMIYMAAVNVLCFLTLLAVEQLTGEHQPLQLMLGEVGVLAMGLAWFIYVGGYIHNLQARIREQRETLALAQSELEHSNSRLQVAMGKLERLAIHDELTNLYNRRYLLERLNEQLSLAERTHSPLHLAMIDLDHFKQVNDRFGHAAGDIVLKDFADLAREQIRRSDFVARYGGEEFIISFCEGSVEDIIAVLERLRQRFTRLGFDKIANGLSVSFSVGISSFHPGDTADSLIARADGALYQAKADGRNCIKVSG